LLFCFISGYARLVFTAFGLLAAHARVAKKSKACFAAKQTSGLLAIASGEAKQASAEMRSFCFLLRFAGGDAMLLSPSAFCYARLRRFCYAKKSLRLASLLAKQSGEASKAEMRSPCEAIKQSKGFAKQ
jgi:hypothetical protein